MMTKEQERDFFNRDFVIQGRIMHPALINPVAKTMPDGSVKPASYSVMLVWPTNSNVQGMPAINAFIQEAMNACHQGINPAVLINPIKDSSYIRQDGKPNPDYTNGCFWVNANSGEKFPPVIVDQNRQQVINPAEVYSGRNAVVNVSFYNMSGAKGGKRGLGVNIKAVMLLEGGEKLEGGAQVDVDKVFGSFQVDAGMTQAQPMQQGQYQAPQAQPQQQQYQAPVPQEKQQWTPPAQQQYQAPAPQEKQQWTPPAQQQQAAPQQNQPAQNPPGHNPFAPQQ